MNKDRYPPMGDDKILDPLTGPDLQGLRSRERRTSTTPRRSAPIRKPKRRKIGRFILLFLFGLGAGWFLHGYFSAELPERPEERPTILSSTFVYPLTGIRLQRASIEEGKSQPSTSFSLSPGETVKLKYTHETLRYVSPERRSSVWAAFLAFFLPPPTLYLGDQALEPGQELSGILKPEKSLTYVLALKSSEDADPLASFNLELEMDAQAWFSRAHAFEDPKEQRACFEKALEIQPDDIPIWMALNKLLMEQKDVQGAVKGYQRVLEIDANNLEANKALATIYWKQEPQKALEIYKKLLELEPDQQVDHYKRIAQLQERLGLSSAETYRKILSLSKDDPDATAGIENLYAKHVAKAQEFEKNGDLAKAIQEMNNALDIQPTSEAKSYLAALYNNLAYVLAKDGKLKEAISNYQASLKYDENATTYLNLADAHLKNKEPDMALKAVEKAASLATNDKELLKAAYLLWAELLTASKQDKEAIEKLAAIQKQLPKDPQLIKTLGVAYWKAGDLSNALETMNTLPPLVESEPDKERAEVYGIIGDLHRELGERENDLNTRISQYDQALKAYGEALSLNSGNQEIQKRWDEVAEERKALKIKALESS
jgi:tetratricopeptide (TPR) repeat protein